MTIILNGLMHTAICEDDHSLEAPSSGQTHGQISISGVQARFFASGHTSLEYAHISRRAAKTIKAPNCAIHERRSWPRKVIR